MSTSEIRTYNVLFCDCPECGSRLNLEEAYVGREVNHTCGMRAEVTAILNGHAICLKVTCEAWEINERPTAVPPPSPLPKIDVAVDPARDTSSMLGAIHALTALNREYLKKNPVPTVMLADVRVKTHHSEARRPIPTLLRDKTADADELAAWRLAELQERGEKASCRVLWSDRGFPLVLLQRQNGSIEIVDELINGRHQ
jgi:hypothetical protein